MSSKALGFSLIFLCAILAADAAYAETSSVCPFSWTRDLKVGVTGSDVLALQRFLNANPATTIASSGPGSPGNESNAFGPRTKAAVVKFQEKYFNEILGPNGLSKGTGVVGPSTRATLESLCAASAEAAQPAASQPAASSTADVLTVSDPGQAPTAIVPANSGALFLTFTLAAGNKDVTVKSITVERRGLGSDGAFSSFGLYDPDGLQIGNIASLDSTHKLVFRQSFVIPADTSQTFQVYANMASDLSAFVGQAPYIQIDDIAASSALVGALPLKGPAQSLNNSLTIGGADSTLSQYDPSVARDAYIGDRAVRFSGIRISAHSQEDLRLDYIIWQQTGTAGPSDLANVVTVVNGSSTPTRVRGRDYISLFDPGIVIGKGQSIDVYVQGDLLPTGAKRTVEFDVYDNTDDISLTGNTYGFAVGIAPSGNTATSGTHSAFITSDGTTDGDTGTPFFAGSATTINGGTVTSIGKN